MSMVNSYDITSMPEYVKTWFLSSDRNRYAMTKNKMISFLEKNNAN